MTRKEILEETAKCILQDRNNQYGSPENNFEIIAKLWSIYLDKEISATDIGVLMTLFKIARIKTSEVPKADNYIDACGYMACAGEIKLQEK